MDEKSSGLGVFADTRMSLKVRQIFAGIYNFCVVQKNRNIKISQKVYAIFESVWLKILHNKHVKVQQVLDIDEISWLHSTLIDTF